MSKPQRFKPDGRFVYRPLDRAFDGTKRQSPDKRGYDSRWKKIRLAILRQQPVCPCGQPAVEVDHIIPRARGGTDDDSNLQGLCKPCHSRKTATEDGGFGRKPRKNATL